MAGTITQKDLFGTLTPDYVHAISDVAENVTFNAGETVYRKGDPAKFFYIVQKGEITLRLPGKDDVSVQIAQLDRGSVFGSCFAFSRASYAVTAQATQDSNVLKIENKLLKQMMERDPRMGFILQSHLCEVYFGRYLDTMKKLQAIIMNLPLETA